jgi:hypothetical protein
MWRTMLSLMLTGASSLALALPVAAQVAEKSADAKSLDQKLLDDLSTDLLEGLDDLPKRPSPAKPPSAQPSNNGNDQSGDPANAGAKSDLDQKLLQQLGDGEDVELGKPADPFTRIGKRMRTVEDLIGAKNTSAKTQQLQREIVDDLAALIAQVQKQKSSGQQSSGSRNSSQAMRQPGDPNGASDQQNNRPATDSTDQVRNAGESTAEADARRDLLKEIWGHLPERIRQQVQNPFDEQFLPKYEKLIEEYYKRLAEDRGN